MHNVLCIILTTKSSDRNDGGVMVSVRRWALVAVVMLGLVVNTATQSLYGSLVGTVTDESGGAIPGATVTVTQVETNLSRNVVTNDAGSYNVPNLLPGTYEIVVT